MNPEDEGYARRMTAEIKTEITRREEQALALRHKNDVLLLVTGWLIGDLLKHGYPPPQEVVDMLAGIGIKLYKDKP